MFTLVVAVLLCAFYMAMNTANVYIVLDDGLEKRVDVILTREDATELNNYFHADFLVADPALSAAFGDSSPYMDYSITGFEHRLEIESLWAWPWDTYATCKVVERVPSITGRVLSSRRNDVPPEIPAWDGGRYDITLVKDGGKWKIIGMRQTSVIVEATPTPTPSPSPTPAAT
jgi:hypothetical protein